MEQSFIYQRENSDSFLSNIAGRTYAASKDRHVKQARLNHAHHQVHHHSSESHVTRNPHSESEVRSDTRDPYSESDWMPHSDRIILECQSSPRFERRKMTFAARRQSVDEAAELSGGDLARVLVTTPHRGSRVLKEDFACEATDDKREDGKKLPLEPMTPHRLAIRQKQIDYGKNTVGYDAYVELVPRDRRGLTDPQTPDIRSSCSRRSWDGQIKKWRRLLHAYDPYADVETPEGDFEMKSASVNLMQSILDGAATEDDEEIVHDARTDEDDFKSPFLNSTTSWASLNATSPFVQKTFQ